MSCPHATAPPKYRVENGLSEIAQVSRTIYVQIADKEERKQGDLQRDNLNSVL
jgi:hypothetical protein